MILHRRGGRNSLHRYSSIVAFPPSLLRMVFRFRASGISSSPLSGIRFPESRDGGLERILHGLPNADCSSTARRQEAFLGILRLGVRKTS